MDDVTRARDNVLALVTTDQQSAFDRILAAIHAHHPQQCAGRAAPVPDAVAQVHAVPSEVCSVRLHHRVDFDQSCSRITQLPWIDVPRWSGEEPQTGRNVLTLTTNEDAPIAPADVVAKGQP